MFEFDELQKQLTTKIFMLIGIFTVVPLAIWLAAGAIGISPYLAAAIVAIAGLGAAFAASQKLSKYALQPTAAVFRALGHISTADTSNVLNTPPSLGDIKFARSITETMLHDVYNFAAGKNEGAIQLESNYKLLLEMLNLSNTPLIALDQHSKIIFINKAGIGLLPDSARLNPIGLDFFKIFNLDHTAGEQDIGNWLSGCRESKLKESQSWQRVALKNDDGSFYLDIQADYNRNQSSGVELLISLIDKTSYYNEQNQDIEFISLAIHELRGPITVMRGFIEVFEDEVSPQLNEEHSKLMLRLSASAKQLSTFVRNVLSVTRTDNGELRLHLQKTDWNDLLSSISKELRPIVESRGRQLELQLPETLPAVSADGTAVYEIVNNLIDNAVKYSPKAGKITIKTHLNNDGQVETLVADEGIGIPDSIIGNLFDRFYRSHRSKESVGGTGIGLYLCRALVHAHGGNIWVHSKEGEGSTFGFSLNQYQVNAGTIETSGPKLIKNNHGWIKNHGSVRR